MIAVIADDFTGAAEIGGVGLRYGLNVLIETVVNDATDVDLLVIATDTRSLGEEAAYEEVAKITQQLIKLNPKLIFKKIDSVLRGHVAKELEAQMRVAGKNKAVIVAANPSVGRTIVNGQYFVDSLPLIETFFADDPDFPVHSSRVTDIVKSSEFPVFSVGLNEELPDSGLIIADVTSHEELCAWATRVNGDMIIAGGSGFFGALLGTIYQLNASPEHADLSFGESSLFVFGSAFPKSASLLEKFDNTKVVRMNMPEGIYYDTGSYTDLLEEWSAQIINQLSNGYSVLVTIDHQPVNDAGLSSLRLRESIGQLVAKVEDCFNLTDLFIEGGATTSVVLKYLNVTKLVPFHEADFGVIQMKANGYPDLSITTKPGSYLWPDNMEF